MDKSINENYKYVISFLSPRIQMYLQKLNENIIENIQEIRLRADRPIVIVTSSGSSFLTLSGKTSYIWSTNCVIAQRNEITDSLNKMCGYSMHSHYVDILNGYVTLPNGSRVGICGTAVFDNENVKGITDINCINIRIPRTVRGVSEPIFKNILSNGLSSIIIAGSPSSGKTTMLKDLAYQLSSGILGKYYKICVVDERKEIFPDRKNLEVLGANTDVILGFPKAKGISIAVRTLSPDVIICDEIGMYDEIDEIIAGMNTGVCFILTIHANSISDLNNKKAFRMLWNNGGVENVVLLKGSESPCIITNIIKKSEDRNEEFLCCSDSVIKHNNYIDVC